MEMDNVRIGKVRSVAVGVWAEHVAFALLALAVIVCSLVVPIAIHGQKNWFAEYNQFFIGPVVNFALIYAAIRFRSRFSIAKIGVLVLLPSVCALTLGLLAFSSVYALYMIPAIWIGNITLVVLFRVFSRKAKTGLDFQVAEAGSAVATSRIASTRNFALVSLCAVVLKAGIIFAFFMILSTAGAIPAPFAAKMFLAMGAFQLVTASIGCVGAYFVRK